MTHAGFLIWGDSLEESTLLTTDAGKAGNVVVIETFNQAQWKS